MFTNDTARRAHYRYLAISLFSLTPLASIAEETPPAETTPVLLPKLTVQAPIELPIGNSGNGTGVTEFSREYLERFGGTDGSPNNLLQQLPGLQFSDDHQGSDALTDLTPSSFSISGGRFYENQFQIDGLSNNNRLDPASRSDGSDIDDIGGHEQSMFIDMDLIESIAVYNSNVPASFGRFTGGVVDITTRRAGPEAEGHLNVSTTRAEWTEFRRFAREVDEDATNASEKPDSPDFMRYRSSLNYSTPLTERLGVLVALSQSYSELPVVSLGETRNRESENLNAMAKFSMDVADNALLDLTLNYSPYQSNSFRQDVKGSDYELDGGGYGIALHYESLSDGIEQEWDIGWNRSQNRRKDQNGFYRWANTSSRMWGSDYDVGLSEEGGYGNIDKTQESSSLKYQAILLPIHYGEVALSHSVGGEASYQRYRFQRKERLYNYRSAIINPDIQCRGITIDCVQNEQYFTSRLVYEKDDVTVDLLETALFAESTLEWQRLTATLGLRYDYNDFLKNHDIAWRSRASYSLDEERNTVITGGYNRYYGGALLTYKLREARRPYYAEYRSSQQNIVGEWQVDSGLGDYKYRFDNLNTPYSDEQTLGIEQALLGGRLSLALMQRENRDEFARTTTDTLSDGYRYYLMNNRGSSNYKGVQLAWYGIYGNTLVSVNATWSETESRNTDYDDPVDETGSSEYVFYRGQRRAYGELEVLREDYNRPIVANIAISQIFTERWQGRLNLRYRGVHTHIAKTGRVEDGELVDNGSGGTDREQLTVYEDQKRPHTLLLDLATSYQLPTLYGLTPSLQVEVNNVMNERVYTVDEGNKGVEPGRQFWLTLEADF